MVKRSDKYSWLIGSSPPPLDPHSLVKHQIIRGYLERYIGVLMSNYNMDKLTLSIVDGFAGGGEYYSPDGQGYSPGSPQIVIDTVAEQEARMNIGREKPRRVDARFYLVEGKPESYEYLGALLRTRYGGARIGQDIVPIPGNFQKHADSIIQDIKRREGGQRAIFLLDQYSFDQVSVPLLQKIFTQVAGAEVILTFAVDSLTSFLADNKKSRGTMDRLGLGQYINWDALEALRSAPPNVWRSGIQRNLAGGLIEGSGAPQSTIFFVTPLGNSAWTYWLVHLSKSGKARDVMMELHWQLGNHFSHHLEPDLFTLGYRANSDRKVTGQDSLALEEVHDFDTVAAEKCKIGLERKLVPMLFSRPDPVEFRAFTDAIRSLTPATTSMVRDSLDVAIRCGDLEALSAKGVRRTKGASVMPTDLIGRSQQRSLIFLP